MILAQWLPFFLAKVASKVTSLLTFDKTGGFPISLNKGQSCSLSLSNQKKRPFWQWTPWNPLKDAMEIKLNYA